MGHETPHWEGLGKIPPQGGPQADREEASEKKGRSMGLPLAEGRDGGGGIVGDRDLHLPPTEHSCTFYCNQAHYGPVSSGGAEAGVKGGQSVVGVG